MSDFKFKLLEVDLTTGNNRIIDVTEDVEKYLGGNGLGNKLVWDLVPQGTDPLSADNILHIGVGPITGLVGCKTSCSFLSPLTGWAGEATVSGYIGDEIMRTGYNAGILIKGKASKPSYLYVNNVNIEIKEEVIVGSLDKALESYQRYLEETPETEMTPEAIRRLADLKIEKEYSAAADTSKVASAKPYPG